MRYKGILCSLSILLIFTNQVILAEEELLQFKPNPQAGIKKRYKEVMEEIIKPAGEARSKETKVEIVEEYETMITKVNADKSYTEETYYLESLTVKDLKKIENKKAGKTLISQYSPEGKIMDMRYKDKEDSETSIGLSEDIIAKLTKKKFRIGESWEDEFKISLSGETNSNMLFKGTFTIKDREKIQNVECIKVLVNGILVLTSRRKLKNIVGHGSYFFTYYYSYPEKELVRLIADYYLTTMDTLIGPSSGNRTIIHIKVDLET